MPDIIVLGGGVAGLATAMLLARDGHDVTVLERDLQPPPATVEDAIDGWARRGVAQFRQPHFLQARGRMVLDAELPDVRDALVAAGARRFDVLGLMPPSIDDRAPRPGDDRFVTVTARRPVLEWVFARAAAEEPGVEMRRGVAAAALLAHRADGIPHVSGVRTDDGDELRADLVVDAMGRGSQLPRLLADAGAAPVAEEAEDSGFVYYSRYFRGRLPGYRAPMLSALADFSLLMLPADNDTWSVTVYIAAGDRALKALRRAQAWTAVVRACPLHAHWLDGEPLTDVLPMGGVLDRHRRFVAAGAPVATGVLSVGDAWACTNPSLGRGVGLALVHASLLRRFVRHHLEHPRELAEVWDVVTEAELEPWYRSTVREDRARLAQLDACRAGVDPPAPPDGDGALLVALPAVCRHDADLFRGFLETRTCLTTPEEVVARPGIAERIRALAPPGAPATPKGPDRARVLELLAA